MVESLDKVDVHQLKKLKWLLTDVDDTLTWEGKLPPETLQALSKLEAVGVNVIAVTGACAGWCDQMAKLWPLHGVIGENGAFWMRKDQQGFTTHYIRNAEMMKREQQTLSHAIESLLLDYPDVSLSLDQPFRFCDVAVNIAQDRVPLSSDVTKNILEKIKHLDIEGQKVHATQSSIHINAWVGNHSKQQTSEAYLTQFAPDEKLDLTEISYVGDSLNDEGMFAWLPLTFGVNNIRSLLPKLNHHPQFITTENGGYGFAELAEKIVKAKLTS